jgi:uncharacterized protein YyaL (SSP411 family)
MHDNRLGTAVSPYLRLHADNPVDWREWGPDAFAEAAARDVPVLVSIGYATCHWCHVMARESFADPEVAEILRQGFVAVKVDREERPDVDASAMAAAAAFTAQLGWPLTVFMTPAAHVFFAGTYYPPTPVGEHPSFRQVLAAVTDAWTDRRDEVDRNAAAIADALRAGGEASAGPAPDLPTEAEVQAVVTELARVEDPEFGGFGAAAPKFPNAPLLEFLDDAGGEVATGILDRTLAAIAGSELRDADGGIFRYATRRDWGVPHYERMLYDNAGLLPFAPTLAPGIVDFLRATLRMPAGSFAAAQDSESTIDGTRVEGAWYRLPLAERADHEAPPIDDQVLTGWNGLAIRGLARAGFVDDARDAADAILAAHVRDGVVTVRSSTSRGASTAPPTIEDTGLLAEGLVELALASGEVRYAVAARALVDGWLGISREGRAGSDTVLASAGTDVGEQPQTALRSGTVGLASAAMLLGTLTGAPEYRQAAVALVASRAREGVTRPLGHADALGLALALGRPSREVVVVGEADGASHTAPDTAHDSRRVPCPDACAMADVARAARAPGTVVAVVTPEQARAWCAAGFELFDGRDAEAPVAYVCHDRVCDLPARTADALAAQLAA